MIGRISIVQDDRKAVFVELEGPTKLKAGDSVKITKKQKARSLKQNAFYWAYLSWCIHPNGGSLCDQGHFSVDGLHEDIKAWFTDQHKHDFEIEGKFTTTELNTKGFSDYFEIVNKELMIEFFGIDTSGFFKDYEKFCQWGDESFNDYMSEKVPPPPF